MPSRQAVEVDSILARISSKIAAAPTSQFGELPKVQAAIRVTIQWMKSILVEQEVVLLASHVVRTSGTTVLSHRSSFARASSALSGTLMLKPLDSPQCREISPRYRQMCLRLIYRRLRVTTLGPFWTGECSETARAQSATPFNFPLPTEGLTVQID